MNSRAVSLSYYYIRMQGQANTFLSFFCLVPWEMIVALLWNIREVHALISVPFWLHTYDTPPSHIAPTRTRAKDLGARPVHSLSILRKEQDGLDVTRQFTFP